MMKVKKKVERGAANARERREARREFIVRDLSLHGWSLQKKELRVLKFNIRTVTAVH